MKRIFTLMFAFAASISFTIAQPVIESTETISKQNVNAFIINIPKADSKTATTAITEYLADKGLVKPKTEDKYTVYKTQKFSYIGDGTYDIYFKAVQKGKKNDVSSDIIFVCSLGNLNTISSSNDATAAGNIKNIMSKFPKAVEKVQLRQRIEEMKKEVEKANKEKAKNDKALKKLQEQIAKATEKNSSLNKQLEDANKLLKEFIID